MNGLEHEPQNEPEVSVASQAEGSGHAVPTVDDNDFPLGKACDLSGEGTCEACQ